MTASPPSTLRVRGARTHNLDDVDVDLPRDRLVVITGVSGSGKSSLAFDTIFAEGQRRYVESLSVGARQFLAQLPKPDVDTIEGLSPAVALSQENRSRNPRSVVGSATEVLDFLRLAFARVGDVFSLHGGAPMRRHTIQDMVDAITALPPRTKFRVMAPVVLNEPVITANASHSSSARASTALRSTTRRWNSWTFPTLSASTRPDATPSRSSWTGWSSRRGARAGSQSPSSWR